MTRTERECDARVARELDGGTPCGPAIAEALADALGVGLDGQTRRQSLMFTEGGGVHDRCAAFQASVMVVGLALGRADASGDRKPVRKANAAVAGAFAEQFGGCLCRGPESCGMAEKRARARCAARALEEELRRRAL